MREDIVLEALIEKRDRIKKEQNIIAGQLENDPTTRIINLHGKFNDFLKKYQGKERTSEEACKVINKLVLEEELIEKDKKTFDLEKLHNRLSNLRFDLGDLEARIASIEYRKKYYEKQE